MNKRILIVDDTPAWRLFHIELIKQLYADTFEIDTANCAFDAFEIIKNNISNPYDLIISDLQMEMDYEPLLAGEWLVENIQKINAYNRSEIILISSMGNISYIAQKYGVKYIPKPLLIHNKLAMKYMFEQIMPFLTKN